MFIALHLPQENDESILHALSTFIMLWSEEEKIWLIDLRPFSSYWQTRAQSSRLPLMSVLRKVLHQVFVPNQRKAKQDVLELIPPFQASCAVSPWKALLLLLSLRERNTKAFVSEEQDFARTLMRELSWSVWWQALEQLNKHLPSKERNALSQGSRRLEHAVARLGFRNVQNMSVLNAPGVRRRFGKAIAEIWQWSFAFSKDDELGENTHLLYSFPWKNFVFNTPVEIPRHLEFPLQMWEHIEPFLHEDLERLCEHSSASIRITKLLWKVTFDDLSILNIPIEFRHPHDLHKQKGDHKTVLLQAYYAFKTLVEDAVQGDPPYPSVLSWRLVLEQSLVIPPWVRDLFGEASQSNADEELLQLENNLNIPLRRFEEREDWLPEDSFAPWNPVLASKQTRNTSYRRLALRRPLFLYKEPQNCREGTHKPVFLESTMTKWWRAKEDGRWQRSYYKRVDEKGQAFWIYQDSTGQWFTHGNFG